MLKGILAKIQYSLHAERKYHAKAYKVILIFLVWAASKLLPTNIGECSCF